MGYKSKPRCKQQSSFPTYLPKQSQQSIAEIEHRVYIC